MSDFSHPAGVVQRLHEIDEEIALLSNEREEAGYAWFRIRPERERVRLVAYTQAEGTAAHRKISADAQAIVVGCEEEARYRVLSDKLEALRDRAMIGMAILKSQEQSVIRR